MSPKANAPSLEQWKHLYESMGEMKRLVPWEFMYEHNIFGISFPKTDRLGFVSVMGNLGEHLAIAVYLDKKGFEDFLTMQDLGYKLTPEIVLQVPQLQASFEDRELITAEDRKMIKKLNLKFRGRQAWPQFRSYRPGCFPWCLEEEEAQMLIHGIEQLMNVVPRFKNEPDLLETSKHDGKYLVRVQEDNKWVDRYEKIKFPQDPPLQLRMDLQALNHLKTLAKRDSIVEVDAQMMEGAVNDEEFDRPIFPFLLMMADQQSRMILGVEILSPLPSLEAMWEDVPAAVVATLANYLLPKEIQAKNPMIALLLSPLEKELGINVKLVSRLPAVEFAQRELRNFTQRRL